MKEDLKKILIHLAAVPGVSGSEGPIARALKSLFEPLVDDVKIDPMGNVIARKKRFRPGAQTHAGVPFRHDRLHSAQHR